MEVKKNIIYTQLLGSAVIIGRISWKALIEDNFKNAVYNSFIFYKIFV